MFNTLVWYSPYIIVVAVGVASLIAIGLAIYTLSRPHVYKSKYRSNHGRQT